MARKLALLTALSGLLTLGAAPAEAAKKRDPCGDPGIELERNKSVRVYELFDEEGNNEIKACRITTRKRTSLFSYFNCSCSTGDESGPSSIDLNGLIVAVVNTPSSGPPGASPGPPPGSAITVTDLGNGRSRTVIGTPDELVLRRQGSFAYRQGAELHAVPREGKDKVIDAGPVQAGSLKLDGKRLSWTSAGQPRSATLD